LLAPESGSLHHAQICALSRTQALPAGMIARYASALQMAHARGGLESAGSSSGNSDNDLKEQTHRMLSGKKVLCSSPAVLNLILSDMPAQSAMYLSHSHAWQFLT